MSVVYLFDLFANPVTGAPIIDVADPPSLETVINGCFVVRVPASVSIDNPTSLSSLITQKYQGLLSENAGFSYITYDEFSQDSDLSAYSGSGIFGQRGTMVLTPGGTLQSGAIALSGSAPAQILVTWEVFSMSDSDPSSGTFQRTYTELPSTPSNLTCMVSTNGGTNYNATTDSSVLSIPGGQMGTSFKIQLTNASSERLYVGSWAVIY